MGDELKLHRRPRVLIFGGMFLVAVSSVSVVLSDAPWWNKLISAGVIGVAVLILRWTARQLREHPGRHRAAPLVVPGGATYAEIRVPGTCVVARATADEIQIRVYRERGRWFWRRTRARTVAAAPYRLKANDTLTVETPTDFPGPYTVRVNNIPVVRYPDQ